MDYGGNDRRKTKGDLKRKRLNRGYKRGGQFRTHNVSETGEEVVKRDKMGKVIEENKKKRGKKR